MGKKHKKRNAKQITNNQKGKNNKMIGFPSPELEQILDDELKNITELSEKSDLDMVLRNILGKYFSSEKHVQMSFIADRFRLQGRAEEQKEATYKKALKGEMENLGFTPEECEEMMKKTAEIIDGKLDERAEEIRKIQKQVQDHENDEMIKHSEEYFLVEYGEDKREEALRIYKKWKTLSDEKVKFEEEKIKLEEERDKIQEDLTVAENATKPDQKKIERLRSELDIAKRKVNVVSGKIDEKWLEINELLGDDLAKFRAKEVEAKKDYVLSKANQIIVANDKDKELLVKFNNAPGAKSKQDIVREMLDKRLREYYQETVAESKKVVEGTRSTTNENLLKEIKNNATQCIMQMSKNAIKECRKEIERLGLNIKYKDFNELVTNFAKEQEKNNQATEEIMAEYSQEQREKYAKLYESGNICSLIAEFESDSSNIEVRKQLIEQFGITGLAKGIKLKGEIDRYNAYAVATQKNKDMANIRNCFTTISDLDGIISCEDTKCFFERMQTFSRNPEGKTITLSISRSEEKEAKTATMPEVKDFITKTLGVRGIVESVNPDFTQEHKAEAVAQYALDIEKFLDVSKEEPKKDKDVVVEATVDDLKDVISKNPLQADTIFEYQGADGKTESVTVADLAVCPYPIIKGMLGSDVADAVEEWRKLNPQNEEEVAKESESRE